MQPTISLVTVSCGCCNTEDDIYSFESPEAAAAFFSEKIEERCSDLDSKTLSETIKSSLQDGEFTWPCDDDLDCENVLKIVHNVPLIQTVRV